MMLRFCSPFSDQADVWCGANEGWCRRLEAIHQAHQVRWWLRGRSLDRTVNDAMMMSIEASSANPSWWHGERACVCVCLYMTRARPGPGIPSRELESYDKECCGTSTSFRKKTRIFSILLTLSGAPLNGGKLDLQLQCVACQRLGSLGKTRATNLYTTLRLLF